LTLTGAQAVRAALEARVSESPNLTGLAFFGHGGEDRLFDADRAPAMDGPALLDRTNVGLLRRCWIHAFACSSGKTLADQAIANGIAIYVGYRCALDVGWAFPPPAEREFVDLVTCTTLALLAGERDERALRRQVSRAADQFVDALGSLPDGDTWRGWMWLHALAQQLVDDMVVARP
jgi:hypothetical protein